MPTPLVSVQWLKAHLDDPDLIVLDGSIPTVTDAGSTLSNLRIPKARFFDIKSEFSEPNAPFPNTLPTVQHFEASAQKLGINNTSRIVVYDQKGIYSSARVWYMFKHFGHDQIAVLDGGLPEWQEQNGLVEPKDEVMDYAPGNFTSGKARDAFLFFKDILNIQERADYVILDARNADRFHGRVPEPRKGLRSGHIPKAVSLPYTQLLDGNCMKSQDELRHIFNTLAVSDKSMVYSCGSGITACVLALATVQSGQEMGKVYDGSWTEYGSLTEAS